MPNTKPIIYMALFISILANVYLGIGLHRFKEALTNQILTTANVEDILRSTDADLSIEGMKRLLDKKHSGSYREFTFQQPDNIYAVSGTNAISFEGTTLYFNQENKYAGSSANIKSAVKYWSFPWSQ